MPKKLYLDDISLDVARGRWWETLKVAGALDPMPAEEIAVTEALGRVTAKPVWAAISSPHYHAAAMDGYAVRSEDTRGATETRPVRLRLGQQAVYVDTGEPIPRDYNAVVMIENAQLLDAEGASAGGEPDRAAYIELMSSAPPWKHVRAMGEDMVATELILPANQRLRPQDLGAIAGCGHENVRVRRRPRIAIQATGTELVAPGQDLPAGAIIEYNSIMLASMAAEWGAEAVRLPPLPDEYGAIRAAVEQALDEFDMVIVNAGSSAGSEDYTATIFEELGEIQVHGIAIRPGHPVVLGVARGKPVAGIPGYPVSAVMTFDLLVKPLIAQLLGQVVEPRPTMEVVMTRKVLSPMGEDEFMRVALGEVGDRVVATPLQRGAGVIMSLVRADGIVHIPRFSEGVHAGEVVNVELLRSPAAVRNTIVVTGSHDMTIDLLADQLRREHPHLTLSSANVGSLSGLLALQRNEAHVAGSHLLDEDTGDYNVGYIERLLKPHGREVVLLGFVERQQGLIVPPGNPKTIHDLEDLAREDVVFINRQRGAGTRVLLDYHLQQRGMDPRQIQGYERQEFTHLTVAAAVKSGAADCTLGILAAARALKLDFVPLFTERYDLVIPLAYYEGELLAPLLKIIHGLEFRRRVEALGGYATPRMGEELLRL